MKVIDSDIVGSGGGKGGGGNSGGDNRNTLRSNSTARFIDLLCEGEIKGLVNGAKSIRIGGTQLEADNGNKNFQGVLWDFRAGLPDQAPLPNQDGVETEVAVGVEVTYNTPVTRTLNDPDYTHARVTIRIPALYQQVGNGVSPARVTFKIEVQHSGGAWTDPFGTLTIEGTNTSPYDKSYRFPLPTGVGVNHPWTIRVTRLEQESATSTHSNAMFFHGLTGIIATQLSYPDSALIGGVINAEQFGNSSVPDREYEVFGRICQVPTNYNPETRAYTGIWDGTFKRAYTDNPAWVTYDVLTEPRAGMGKFIKNIHADKWTLYTIGQYCDGLVPDGFGGTEPRCTVNAYIEDEYQAFELLQLMASVFRGMSFWSSGTVTASQDRPQDPVLLVTSANVIDGEFVMVGSAGQVRTTVVEVGYLDGKDHMRPAMEVVRDDEGVIRYGERVKRITAFGCNSRGQAHRLGLWVLNSDIRETQALTYRAGMDHAFLRPGDIISVSDPEMAGVALGGRVKSSSTASQIDLDREIVFESAKTYSLFLMMPDGSVEERALPTLNGSLATVAPTTAFPSAPVPNAMWIISASDVKPKPWRVIAIKEEEPHIFGVTAIEHDTTKYARIDQGQEFDEPVYTREPVADAPTNLAAIEHHFFEEGVPKSTLTFSWKTAATAYSSLFRVQIVTPTGTLNYDSYRGNTISVPCTLGGDFILRVYTMGLLGAMSEAAELTYEATGWVGSAMPSVTDLRVSNATAGVLTDTHAVVEWTNTFPGTEASTTLYRNNKVKIYDMAVPLAPVLLKEYTVAVPRFEYTAEMNKADTLALARDPARALRFDVTVTDSYNRTSAVASVAATNAALPAPTVSVVAGFNQLFISWNGSDAVDYVGSKVWVSTTLDFDPDTVTPVFVGAGASYVAPAQGIVPHYIRVGSYDRMGDFDMILSSQVSATPLNSVVDTTPPATPTGLVLDAQVVIDELGQPVVQVIATWDGNVEADLAYYDVEIKEGSGNFVSFQTGNARIEWAVRPGVGYTVQVSAVDQMGNRSAPTATATITAARDSDAPAQVLAFNATAVFRSIWLTWDPNSEPDLSHYEIFVALTEAGAPNAESETEFKAIGESYVHSGLATGSTRWYWVRAVDTSGNRGPWSAPDSATTGVVAEPDLGDGVIQAKFALIETAFIENGHIVDLDAAKITAGTVLAGSIKVATGAGDLSLSDPAAIANANTTKIDPGKILISGTTSLADWRKGGDDTKIDGGALSANTVKANSVEIGMRGLTLAGIQFEHNAPAVNQVSWTVGTITYVDDAGVTQTVSTTAAHASWTAGTVYIYWTKGATSISATSVLATAMAANNVVLAAYRGGTDLVSTYGRTVIDGSVIKTGTVDTAQLKANSVKAAQIDALAINAGHIAAGAVTATKINVASLDAISATLGNVSVSGALVVNGTLSGSALANLTIPTGKIADEAVNISAVYVNAAQQIVTNGGGVEIASAALVVAGGQVFIDVAFSHNSSYTDSQSSQGPRDSSCLLYIYRNGSLIRGPIGSMSGRVTDIFRDAPGAGTHTYSAAVYALNGSNNDTYSTSITDRVLRVLNTKK